MAPQRVQWITGFESAQAILLHRAFREVTFKGLVPLLGHVIVTLEGQAHRERRTLAGQLFWPSVLATAESNLIEPIVQQVLASSALRSGQADLVEISYEISTRLAARLLGLDEVDSPERVKHLVSLLGGLVSGTRSQPEAGMAPLTRRAARDGLRQNFIDAAISRRRNLLVSYQAGKITRNELSTDLITLLLLHNTIQTGPKWDTRQITGEVAFYAVAAIDTTASLVPHLLHELWQFTKLQPAYNPSLSDRTFLRAAAAETLRLHPAIPTIFREATEPVDLPDGLHFEPGETAGLYVTDANQDQTIFGADAAEFNPLRVVAAKVRRAGLSFGGGVHLCLGRELAVGTPEGSDATELWGQAALVAEALLQHGARIDPARPVPDLSPYARDTYQRYPILLD